MDDKGYQFLSGGVFNLNLIAVRSEDSSPTRFDDHLHVIYRSHDNRFKQHIFDINTCPGKHPIMNPWNVLGNDILVPGQYKNLYRLRDGYLKQRVSVYVVHDEQWNSKPDFGLYSSFEKKLVNETKESNGCNMICAHSLKKALGINYYKGPLQVLRNWKDLDIILHICANHIAAGHFGLFNYTLLEERDLC